MSRYSYGPTPIQHDHVGQMKFLENRCFCEGCGQEWRMQRDTDQFGKVKCKWIPVVDHEPSGRTWG